jgi:aminoglycoside 2''-phosphotransferase
LESRLSVEEYLERIKRDFFEPVNSYKIIQDGWTNLVVEINEQWIFRFVRDKNNQQITVEQDFLPRFAQVCPINIPDIIMRGCDYIAYRKILGERFAPEKFSLFSNSQKTKLIKNLGEFLTCLHNFKFDHQYLSQTPYGGGDFWHDLWLLVKDDLSPQTRYKAENYFTQAIKQINTVLFEPTLIHADLGTNNVLVNFKQNSLGGVIDFGDLCLGDPAADFAGFYRNFGRQFTQELISYYQRPIEANFWTRIEYESKRKMFFVVYFAMNYGFESHIPNILQSIEKLF